MVWPFKNKDKATADLLAAQIIAHRAVDATLPNADALKALRVADLVSANPSAAREAEKILAASSADPHKERFSEGADQVKARDLIANWLYLINASGESTDKQATADLIARRAVEATTLGGKSRQASVILEQDSVVLDLTIVNRAAAEEARKVLDKNPRGQWWPEGTDLAKAKILLNSEIRLTDATIHDLEKLQSTPARAQSSPGKGQASIK